MFRYSATSPAAWTRHWAASAWFPRYNETGVTLNTTVTFTHNQWETQGRASVKIWLAVEGIIFFCHRCTCVPYTTFKWHFTTWSPTIRLLAHLACLFYSHRRCENMHFTKCLPNTVKYSWYLVSAFPNQSPTRAWDMMKSTLIKIQRLYKIYSFIWLVYYAVNKNISHFWWRPWKHSTIHRLRL